MTVITASGDNLTDASDPSRIMMRQIADSFAEYEKRRLIQKLREARERSGAWKSAIVSMVIFAWPISP